MLDANGFEVQDLGVDVTPEKFVAAIRQTQPQIVGMSALLTSVFESLLNYGCSYQSCRTLQRGKDHDRHGTVIDDVCKYSGADAYGKDAVAAVNLSKKWVAMIDKGE